MGFESIINNAPEFNASVLPAERRYRPDLAKPRVMLYVVLGILGYMIFTTVFSMFWPLVPTWYFLIACLTGVFYLTSKSVSNTVESARLANFGKTYLYKGRLTKGAELLERAGALAIRNAALLHYIVYYRAQIFLLDGDAKKALSLFAANYYSKAPLHAHSSTPFFYSLSISQMARCHALLGQLREAEEWQAFAHTHADAHWNGSLVVTDAVIAARLGRTEILLKDLEGRWAAVDATLETWERRALNFFLAFGLSQVNANGARDAEIEQWLGGLHPRDAGEFNYLATNWPELQAFISEKKL